MKNKELGHFKWLESFSQEGVVSLEKTGNVFFSNDSCYFYKKVIGDQNIEPHPLDVFEFDTSHLEPYCFILNAKHMKKVSDKIKDQYWSDRIIQDLENGYFSDNLFERLLK